MITLDRRGYIRAAVFCRAIWSEKHVRGWFIPQDSSAIKIYAHHLKQCPKGGKQITIMSQSFKLRSQPRI